MYLIPATTQDAEKQGFEWLSAIDSYCNSCNQETPIIIYGLKESSTDFGYGRMEYFCEKCGMNQNQ